MSPALQGLSGSLPDTTGVRAPRNSFFYTMRWFGRWAVRRRYRVRLHGVEHVPSSGGVIFCSNHIGVIDGPLLAIFAPRPVHALTKDDLFRGPLGRFLLAVGQIPLFRDGADTAAIKTCVKVLREGRAVGIYPEGTRGPGEYEVFHHGAAYLAMVTGAPVVPVVMFGSREPGRSRSSLPRRGAAIDLVFGPPFTTEQVPWPRRREHVDRISALLREHLLDHLSTARAVTGRSLPGPLPGAPAVPTPVLDQGAS
ncbi:lysophospholipid acyltransferase family protein [Nocardioides sp. BP30]|uniref:lysophospholipid acyltransferase family protein n=1 Tax=Nocardioides sp. BP30 TaxID=3036374 RepID=UPI0024688473|nr:lysophospholipid acyltransferase family protein [Nocardioides sp. BP30]WGL50534.1 lysophospholipid acyltransferase family protein [Nocardioides sp. BP30]